MVGSNGNPPIGNLQIGYLIKAVAGRTSKHIRPVIHNNLLFINTQAYNVLLSMVLVLVLTRYWYFGERLKSGTDYLVLAAVALASLLGGVLIYWLWATIKLEALVLVSELADLGLGNTA